MAEEDVYRTAPNNEPKTELGREDLLTPILFLSVGAVLLGIGVWGGAEHGVEGGLGVLAIVFAIRCLIERYRS